MRSVYAGLGLVVILAVIIMILAKRQEVSSSRPETQSATEHLNPRGQSKPYSVADRVNQLGDSVRRRLIPYFEAAGVPYPPHTLKLVGLKQERRLELYAGVNPSALRFIRSYPILAASGTLGPKQREGDRQVPEGLYRIDGLNPNSRFHLSLRVNYPNEFDRMTANTEGRDNLGGDIFIHGSAVSIGCLAIGDEAAEDVFILAAETKAEPIGVILSPVDFRVATLSAEQLHRYSWTARLYQQLEQALLKLPAANPATRQISRSR